MTWRARLLPYGRTALRRLTPVRFGDELRTEPVSRLFGFDRGTPIDRYYIERFLSQEAAAIRGRALEVGEARYVRRFGANVVQADVLHVEAGPGVTVVGDLSRPESLPQETMDCFVCTQTFNFIFDVAAAVRGAHRLLKPGGVLLVTVAGLCQVSRYDMDRWGDYWRFTDASLTRMLTAVFESVRVSSFGNVLAAKALLDGLSVEDLPRADVLDAMDPDYPVVLGAVARRS